jgi:hypothetical protein
MAPVMAWVGQAVWHKPQRRQTREGDTMTLELIC